MELAMVPTWYVGHGFSKSVMVSAKASDAWEGRELQLLVLQVWNDILLINPT